MSQIVEWVTRLLAYQSFRDFLSEQTRATLIRYTDFTTCKGGGIAQDFHSVSLVNERQASQTSLTAEFVYHCADIVTGFCRGHELVLVI